MKQVHMKPIKSAYENKQNNEEKQLLFNYFFFSLFTKRDTFKVHPVKFENRLPIEG